MRNTEKYDVRRVIIISFGDFEKLIDDATDGLKTVEFTPGIFLNNSEKAEKEEVYEQRNACEILSDYFGVSVFAVNMDIEKESVLVFYNDDIDSSKFSSENVIAALSEQTGSEIWKILSESQRDGVYRMKMKEYVIEDALSVMDNICDVDIPEDEVTRQDIAEEMSIEEESEKDITENNTQSEEDVTRQDIAEATADDYAFYGLYDCNISYWDNIEKLIRRHL